MVIKDKKFENCRFENSYCSEAKFLNCRFVDCAFKSCNLNNAQLDNTSMNEVVFYESKLIGINWTKLKWPLVKLNSPLAFYQSNISHSSFYGLELREIVIEACKAHDVDFREADLSYASLVLTNFEKSQFIHTKLRSADFSEAINYYIDPNENDVRKAKFTLPDAIHLLRAFDIEIAT